MVVGAGTGDSRLPSNNDDEAVDDIAETAAFAIDDRLDNGENEDAVDDDKVTRPFELDDNESFTELSAGD